ncbi:ferrochelatase [Methylophaga sp. OBS1]|uniref:ferrochelatase n=1 Tax=Methylophaga sp. OBS1 TaxID=2991933 RepID=UPI00225BA144|nr:ferrochelatase [Methylophaga sp. OBS1]MCX4193700.1 ferrochelatase [Methylophaga sp. OBS1]
MTKRAVLLANLGSPDAPETGPVRRYLNQFLMDPYVIQLPWVLRRLIVSLFVLPSRPKDSAAAYRSVWTDEGSPLIVLSERLKSAVEKQVEMPLAMAMRYGNPSIEQQLLKLCEDKTIEEVFYIPLYPHFADSTITTSIEEARRVIRDHNLNVTLKVIDPFYDHPDYINALVESAQPYLDQDYDHLVFSYHGLPETHITKLDKSGSHCLQQDNCCQIPHPAHKTCYRHQVMRTTECFASRANLPADRYSVAFQSRLGRAKWLGPNTEDRLTELAQSGAKNVLVICPAFVTDCLETLEEIAIRGEEVFQEAGGESLTLIPCMNDHPAWVNLLADWCQQ